MTDRLAKNLESVFVGSVLSSVCEGVHYIIVSDSYAKTNFHKVADDVWKEQSGCGYAVGELWDKETYPGGSVLIFSDKLVKQLLAKVAKPINTDDWKETVTEIIAEYDESVQRGKERLARAVTANLKQGLSKLGVCLFATEDRDRLVFQAKYKDKDVELTYPSFCLTNKDIADVNKALLIPKGLRVSGVTYTGETPLRDGIITMLDLELLN
jgi:hypothetical protein